ncbi:T9SS type A sorting domain-containing protein [Litoribaculum gwangyangense]|uniref:Leucine-rich repeat protein n=1 Tax=Litoribaculum gwangyangense TaxID=1130722 RepID=A0ABP9CMP8_9FLAO
MKKITLSCLTLLLAFASWGQITYINEDFQDTDISGGVVKLNATNFAKYNYTADMAGGQENWNAGPTVADKTNSVSVSGGSAGCQFFADSFGGQQCIAMRGSANYANVDTGIFFTGLDLTGQSMLYFEFEVYGGNPSDNANITPTLQSWNINLNHGNSDNSFAISDSYFAAGPNVATNIPFDITNGTTNPTNQTSFDIIPGQWIKISGSVDLSGKPLGTFAIFQIQTDTGGFLTAAGGYTIFSLDNVKVSATSTLSNNSFELKTDLKIYPNPVKNVLKIQSKSNLDISNLSLVNVLGKTVYTSKALNDIDVSPLAKGLYFLKINSLEYGVFSKKVMIE